MCFELKVVTRLSLILTNRVMSDYQLIETRLPAAVRLNSKTHAPNHEGTGAIIICPTCREKYGLAPHDDHGWTKSQRKCMLELLEKLDQDHKSLQGHKDWYIFE